MNEPTVRPVATAETDPVEPVSLQDFARGQLDRIQDTMDRTTAFTGSSGRSTVLVGILALLVSAASWSSEPRAWLIWWATLGPTALVVGLAGMIWKARQQAQPLTGPAGRRFLLGLVPSLVAGLLLSVVVYTRGMPDLLPGVWLLTFGLGVMACGLASTALVPVMGLSFVLLSPLALLGPSAWGRPLLAVGFGVFNVVFGILIARRHGG